MTKREWCLLVPGLFHNLFSLLSYITQDHLLRDGPAHCELGPSISIINQESVPQTCWGQSDGGNLSTEVPSSQVKNHHYFLFSGIILHRIVWLLIWADLFLIVCLNEEIFKPLPIQCYFFFPLRKITGTLKGKEWPHHGKMLMFYFRMTNGQRQWKRLQESLY